MPTKEKLLKKLFAHPMPTSFTIWELDALMAKCNCEKRQGRRGSSIVYYHRDSGRILTFDLPHPRKELYRYQIAMVREFIRDVKEDDPDAD